MLRAVLGTVLPSLLAILLTASAQSSPQTGSTPEVEVFETYTLEIHAVREFSQAWRGGPQSATTNPWLHIRLNAYFDHPSLSEPIRVPGYFAGDGQGGGVGSVWRAHFTPPFEGTWVVAASMESGPNLNAAAPGGFPQPVEIEPYEPLLEVVPTSPEAPGFRDRGFVRWDRRGPYFGYSGSGRSRFVQAGVGSPENFLGYEGFEDARDGRSGAGSICCCRQRCFNDCQRTLCQDAGDGAPNFLHRYQPHVADWNPGDPDWAANGVPGQGRGIIGALNYLGDECGVNSMYVLVMNLGGDGKDTHPFLEDAGALDCPLTGSSFDPGHTLNYHVRRLEQWRTVLEHANNKGIMVQLLLAEQEACNIRWFGPHSSEGGPRNHMSLYRRLFMKQMVAHFGHLLALRWNLCEENRPTASCQSGACGAPATMLTPQFTAAELDQMGRFIREWDANAHPIGIHTIPNNTQVTEDLLALPEFPDWLSSASTQVHGETGTGDVYESELKRLGGILDQAGFTMPLINDEQGSPSAGLSAETNGGALSTSTADDRRRRVLFDTLLSGGQISYYFGYYNPNAGGGDLRTEDFRSRDSALKQLGFARRMMEEILIWRHIDADEALSGNLPTSPYGEPEVSIEKNGETVAVYYSGLGGPQGIPATLGDLDLRPYPDRRYRATWYLAATGEILDASSEYQGGQIERLGTPLPLLLPGGGYGPDTDVLLILDTREPTDRPNGSLLTGPPH